MKTTARNSVFLLLALCAACTRRAANPEVAAVSQPTKPKASEAQGSERKADERSTLEGTLHVEPEGKARFQGAWLEVGGERVILDYFARPWWRAIDGRRVRVKGTRYTPENQALLAPHLRVDSLETLPGEHEPGFDPMTADPMSLGPEQTLSGKFALHVWPAGSKLGDDPPWLVFVDEAGTEYWLAHRERIEPLIAGTPRAPNGEQAGARVRVLARSFEPSRFIARPGGPWLWIAEVNDAQ